MIGPRLASNGPIRDGAGIGWSWLRSASGDGKREHDSKREHDGKREHGGKREHVGKREELSSNEFQRLVIWLRL
jgi:hypothetical protein